MPCRAGHFSVCFIADQRVAQSRHMHTNLMCPSRFQRTFRQTDRAAGIKADCPVMRLRSFAAGFDNGHFFAINGTASDLRFNYALRRKQSAPNQSQITPFQAVNGELKVGRQSTKRKILSGASEGQRSAPKAVKKSGEGFAAVAGMDELKARLREEVIEPLHNPAEYERYGVTIPNGMLLYGPPGCGKTFFAKHFADSFPFLY